MDLFFILLLLLAALIVVALILVEIFFIPGVGLAGFFGGLAFLGAEYYLLSQGYTWFAILFLLLCIILFGIGFYILSRKKVISKIALNKNVEGAAVTTPTTVKVGDIGIAKSRLALGGEVEIGDEVFEATSESGMIDEKSPVIVSRIFKDKIYVVLYDKEESEVADNSCVITQ
ncbi:MAG: NfeD family protein [Porphyromonas sp.]|nr:NfeD family protein [Porphyromonas sp.]